MNNSAGLLVVKIAVYPPNYYRSVFHLAAPSPICTPEGYRILPIVPINNRLIF